VSAPQAPPWAGRLLVAVLVLMLGTLALRSAWVGWAAWPLLFIASLAGLATVWLLRRVGVNAAIVALVALVVPLSLLTVLGRAETQGAWAGVVNTFPTLLTSPYPAPVTSVLLAPGLAIAWAGGAITGAGLTRRTFILTPLLAGLLLLVAADLLTTGGSDRYGLISLGLVAVLLAHWSAWATRGRLGLPPASGLAVLLGVLALFVGFLPLSLPFQPRDLIQPPVTSVAEPNPLPMLGHWAHHPDEEILRRTGDDYPVHLVVLPDYNGVSFESRSEYVPLGSAEQPVLPPGRFRKTVETAITWRTTSRWLPAPGVPIDVSVPGALVDVDTGSLIGPEVPRGGIVSYTVRGQVDAPRIEELAAADVGRHPRYTALPDVPPELAGYAREVTRDAGSYLQQARALERAVKGGRGFDPDAPGGSSYGRLRQFLFDPVEGGGRRGTSEQFATAYAVLARSVGLPARVVVGFGAGMPLATDPETNVVRGRDALAWPEVYFQGFGWVPFNPTPDVQNVDTPADTRSEASRPRPTPTQRPTPPPLPLPLSGPPSREWWWLLPLGLLVTVGVSAAGLGLARRSRSARQRQKGTIGAWLKVEDAFVLAGRPTDAAHPAPERAAALGLPGAQQLAVAAERVAFAAEPPEGGAKAEDWERAGQVDRALRADSVWWRRLLWPVNPVVWFRSRRS
jgi:transglutaminase-like putative cysteine protease